MKSNISKLKMRTRPDFKSNSIIPGEAKVYRASSNDGDQVQFEFEVLT
jgi:hypothetical protein